MTGLLFSTPSTSTAYLAGSKHGKSVRSTTEIGNSKSTGNSWRTSLAARCSRSTWRNVHKVLGWLGMGVKGPYWGGTNESCSIYLAYLLVLLIGVLTHQWLLKDMMICRELKDGSISSEPCCERSTPFLRQSSIVSVPQPRRAVRYRHPTLCSLISSRVTLNLLATLTLKRAEAPLSELLNFPLLRDSLPIHRNTDPLNPTHYRQPRCQIAFEEWPGRYDGQKRQSRAS